MTQNLQNNMKEKKKKVPKPMGLSTNIKAKLTLDMNVNLSVWSAAGADLPTVVTLLTGGSFYSAKG